MIEIDDVYELLQSLSVIILISFIIALAWKSTYVNYNSYITTALVVVETPTSQTSTTPVSTASQMPTTTTPSSTVTTASQSTQTATPFYRVNASTSSSNSSRDTSVSSSSETGNYCEEETSSTLKKENCSRDLNMSNKEKESIIRNSFHSDKLKSEELNREKSDDFESERIIRIENVPFGDNSNTSNRSSSGSINDSTSENNSPATEDGSPSITVKLKFLDDTHRLVSGQMSEEIGSFKRAHFSSELSSNHVVRLIFNGRLLNEDSLTLAQCGLFNNCTVHCHVSQAPASRSTNQRRRRSEEQNGAMDLSELLNPLLIGIIVFLWYLRFEYGHVFNTPATIILVCLTALLLISQYALVISFNVSFQYDNDSPNNITANSSGIQSVATGQISSISPSVVPESSSVDSSSGDDGSSPVHNARVEDIQTLGSTPNSDEDVRLRRRNTVPETVCSVE